MPAKPKLKPDLALYDRRAAGAQLAELAADYGVSAAALSRHFNTAIGLNALDDAEQRVQADPPLKHLAPKRPAQGRPVDPDGGCTVLRGFTCYCVPLSLFPSVIGCSTRAGAGPTLALFREHDDLILDAPRADGGEPYTYPVLTTDGSRRRMVCVKRSFVMGQVYDACEAPHEIKALGKHRRRPVRSGYSTGEVTIGDGYGSLDHGRLNPV